MPKKSTPNGDTCKGQLERSRCQTGRNEIEKNEVGKSGPRLESTIEGLITKMTVIFQDDQNDRCMAKMTVKFTTKMTVS